MGFLQVLKCLNLPSAFLSFSSKNVKKKLTNNLDIYIQRTYCWIVFPSMYSLNFLYLVLKSLNLIIHLHKTCGDHDKPNYFRNEAYFFIKALGEIIQLNPVYNLSCIVGQIVFSWDHFSGWINFWLRIGNVMSVLHRYFHHVSLCTWQPNRKIG